MSFVQRSKPSFSLLIMPWILAAPLLCGNEARGRSGGRVDGVEAVRSRDDAIFTTTSSSTSMKTLSQHPNFSSLTLSKSFSMWTCMEVGSLLPNTESNSSSDIK